MSSFVLSLSSPEATLHVAGGKGTNLAAMVRAGFPVPPGFLLLSTAYRAFVVANALDDWIVGLCRSVCMTDPDALETASQAILDRFNRASIPDEIARDLIEGYRQLTEDVRNPKAEVRSDGGSAALADHPLQGGSDALPVAVRSSATAEDLPDASFAGQQETYLNVRGEVALQKAVKRCWSSLWTARAIAYRARQDIDPAAVSLAMIVQQMVPAESAGILFTVNPMDGNRDEALINAAWGLGEAVVAGRVTPDTIVVDKATGRPKHVEIGDKAVMTVPAADGTLEVPVELRQRRQSVLKPERVAELVRLGRALEAHFGVPQDVEWAIAGGRMYILQSRSVTRLPQAQSAPPGDELVVPGDDNWPAVDERPAQPFDLWTRAALLGEVWPHPVSPLMWSGIPVIIGASIRYSLRGLSSPYLDDARWAGRFYGRVYYNEGALTHLLSEELGLPGSLVDAAVGSRQSSDRQRNKGFRPAPFVRRLPFLLRMIMSQLRTGRALEDLFPQIDRWVSDFSGPNLDGLSDGELWAECMVWVERFKRAINLQSEMSNMGVTAFTMLERLTVHWFNRKDLAQDLISDLSGVYAAEMGPALWQMAQMLRKLGLDGVVLDNDPRAALTQLREMPSAEPVLQMLDSFLQRHGHRCANEGEWLYPRWADAPEQLIEMVVGYLRAGDRLKLQETEAHPRRRREEATAWVEAHLDPVRRSLFRRVLARAQHGARLRDNGKHYYMKLALPVRRIIVLFGERWTRYGWLGQPDDIFFLTFPDVVRIIEAGDPASVGLHLPTLVAERRKAFEYWFDVEAPEVIGPDGRPIAVQPTGKSSGPVLWGIPASGGQARGTARIIHDPREAARLQPGDILVTWATDPGWTTVFPLVAGLVLEVGGQLSHASIVAREYGVPAVVNVHHATRQIHDGQAITVDGTTGCVHLHD